MWALAWDSLQLRGSCADSLFSCINFSQAVNGKHEGALVT